MTKAWLLSGVLLGCTHSAGDPLLDELRAPPEGSTTYAFFEGKVPCATCEKVKIGLTLHQDAVSEAPTTFVLERIFVADGNTRHATLGTWTLEEGPPWFAEGTVLRLGDPIDPPAVLPEETAIEAAPAELTTWLMLRDRLLLLLDDELEPRVGNASYSWTLSRME
jgi:hypothetical protein